METEFKAVSICDKPEDISISIAAIGNPVLDITSISNEKTLKKFGLEFGKTVFINNQNEGFFKVLESQKEVHYTPGGSITNSIRIAKVI
jgi:hypothetical protein